MTFNTQKPTRAVWAGFSSLALLAISWAPLVARAEPGVCDLDNSGNRVCGPSMSCVTRADCIMGAGTDDETCQDIALGTGSVTRECMPDCTTLFSCGSASDCPRVNDIGPTCSPVAMGTTTLPSICTWTAGATTTTPLAAQITYCTAPGNHIAPSQITACHRRADDPTMFTTDYFRGDCDGDGCPNGHDTNPCMVDPTGSCTPSIAPFESPFCAPLPALACTFGDTGIVCGDARPCNPASASILPCSIGTCEDGWSEVPRCRPTCGTLFLCATGALAGGGSPPEQCPLLNGSIGQCLPLPASIDSVDGRDGLCIYSDFFDTSCLSGTGPGSACFMQPDGMLTDNYWAGDCDGDGAPNACDDMICADGGGTMSCDSPAGAACTPTYTLPDAGVDGGPTEDAATTQADSGASSGDAGNTASDASTMNDGGVQAGFSGGGGCHCAAAGTTSRPWGGAALALLTLGLVLRSRRRRW